jgi:phosphodiesterase/alkaline phosphatase D-like protein
MVGCPTDKSIVINVVPDEGIYELFHEYGTTSGNYSVQTIAGSAFAHQPYENVIEGLTSNTRYFYRMQYRISPGGILYSRDEHSFQTQRQVGSTFIFTVTSDSHHQMNAAHQQAMENIKNDQPDFNLDLGDTFITDNYLGVYRLQQLAYGENPDFLNEIINKNR